MNRKQIAVQGYAVLGGRRGVPAPPGRRLLILGLGLNPGLPSVGEAFFLPERGVGLQPVDQKGGGIQCCLAMWRGGGHQHDVLAGQQAPDPMDQRAAQDGEAALGLGATPFEAWRLVTLPLAIPGVLAAAVLCFILTMNAYATPVLLGGPRFQMMAPVVANEVLNQNNWPFGAALSFMLMIVTLLLTVIANVVVARRYSH